jgi:hypothetical protein
MVSFDANGSNRELIHKEHTRAAHDGLLMHPLVVWDRVRCSGESPKTLLLQRLPVHFREELDRCLSALEESYFWIRKEVDAVLCRQSGTASSGSFVSVIQSHQLSTEWFSTALSQPMVSSKTESEAVNEQQNSLGWSAPGPLSIAFRLALDHAVLTRKKSAGPLSMYWQKQSANHQGRMRCLLRDCIRPGYDGSLPGYSPSPRVFEMLPAGGWGSGPRAGGLASLNSGPLSMLLKMLDSELILAVLVELKALDKWALRRASLVCHEWYSVINATPEFHKKITQKMNLQWPSYHSQAYYNRDYKVLYDSEYGIDDPHQDYGDYECEVYCCNHDFYLGR